MAKKKQPKDINSFIFSYQPPKPELNDKKVKDIEKLLNDNSLNWSDRGELRRLVEGYNAGKDATSKKGKGKK
jgi:hypothetical protein